MSILSSWRQFQLFDYTPLKDPNYQSNDPLYSDPTLSAINATKSYIIISVNNSTLKIINPKDITCVCQFQAYEIGYRVTFIEPLKNSSNLIITLAEKQGFSSVIKLWDLTKIQNLENVEESDYKFKFQTQVTVNSTGSEGIGDNSFPISCFKFTFDLTCLAIGYTNGKVILVRGDLLRDRGAKQRVIFESVANDPITGIQFNEKEQILYISTTSKILTVTTTGRNQGKPLRILSQKSGADLHCTATSSKQELIVGLPDSIRYYNPTSKIKTINFEIPKSRILRYRSFILMISPQTDEKSSKVQTRIIILDSKNNHISFNLLIPNNAIRFVFKLNEDIFFLSNDGILYKIFEKPINQQIESILQRELFTVAFSLAKQHKLTADSLLRIQKLHGDYLYEEQKYNEAINVYIDCLELFTEKSEEDEEEFIMNIITKFKEATNINNLVKFLQKLYSKSVANVDHITLLLCCLCKLKNLTELDLFIDNFDLSIDNLQNLNFPLIINLFKECGFFEQVLKLLFKLNQSDLIVDLQLYDLQKPKLALNYMKSLKIDDLLIILIDHSKKLLDDCPIETTELLINVFTGKYKPKEIEGPKVGTNNNNKSEEDMEKSVELTNYKAFLNYLSLSSSEENEGELKAESNGDNKNITVKEPTYLPPKPNLIYSSFTNHPNEFVIFLEACIEAFDKYQGNIMDKKEVLITLLEMYLSLHKTTDQEEWLNKANDLTTQYQKLLDSKSLLLLSHLYDFKLGNVVVKENSNDEEDLFLTYQTNEDIEGCFKVLEKYGSKKPILYKLMLETIISSEKIYKKINKEDIQIVLQQIRKHKLMEPMELINLLVSSENEFIQFGLVKDYLLQYFIQQEQEIVNNEKLIELYEQESIKNSYKLSELTHPFVIQNSKCSLCQLKLDFPMIHFKCKHSFHQKCLSTNLILYKNEYENDEELNSCPLCIQEINETKELKQQQFKLKDNYDIFADSLKNTNDSFKFISDYIGKGVMENESITFEP
ncbi:vps11 [Candida pseudojiufengensis]|uniref:vps11 n=1 Tax=Candida pseudojiufengensis TaxID=497109 RepID=UPI002224CC99|nr:vps11 [Candida pseudojiufengensis]KAI5965811.1 vps11 [Candida pseudojiufengensis]